MYVNECIKLQFIGKDGSMGLQKNKSYWVRIYTKNHHIVAQWEENKLCPYSSLNKFNENWRDSP